MIRFLTLVFLLNHTLCYAGSTTINKKISKLNLAKKDISIIVQGVNDSKPLVSINPKTLRIPASVNKILTTYASLIHLGSTYRWQTKFYTNGSLKNGELNGDLIVKGFGDPDLRTEDLDEIVEAIRSNNIVNIKGNLIIDQTYFKVSNKNWTNFDDNTYSHYNASPNGFMFNYHSTSLRVVTDYKRNRVAIYRDFPDYSYSIINKIIPVKKKCRGKYSYAKVKIKKILMVEL